MPMDYLEYIIRYTVGGVVGTALCLHHVLSCQTKVRRGVYIMWKGKVIQ